jgi:ShK domain-like
MQWGAPQDSDSEIQEKVKLKAILMAMKKYALYNVTLFPLEGRRNCHNLHSNCGVRAANGECDTHFSEMITSCPLVCQLCHQKSIYEKCSLANLSSPLQPYLLSNGIEQVFQHLLSMEGSKLLTKASDIGVGNPIDTWILRWDNLFSHKDIEDLLALTRTLGWKHSRPIATNSIENFGVIRCQSRSASCDEMCQTEHGIYRKVLEILADLLPGDAISYMEPLEFIYFDEMESCAEHHDYSREDKWMIPGPRVLSLALTLTVPSEGGALGFPKLDWLSIPPRAGQFLLWPNVLSSDPNKPNLMMTSEALPPIVGQKFIIKTSVRLYKYQQAIDRGCVR